MRILQVTQVSPELGGINTGGIAIHAEGLSRHLLQAGHDVTVLADNRPFSEPWPEDISGLSVLGIRDFKGPLRTEALRAPDAISMTTRARAVLGKQWRFRVLAAKVAAYRQALARARPEVIHVHGLENRTTMIHLLDGGRTPTVSTMHSTHSMEFVDPKLQPVMKHVVGWNLERVTDVIYVSEFLKRRAAELLPGPTEHPRAWVVPNPLVTATYAPVPRDEARGRLGLGPDTAVLLLVGNLIPRKDPQTFVRALARLALGGRDAVGIVVGEGPEQEAMLEIAREASLGERLRFVGFQPQEELATYYSACDVFVLTSLMESYGLVAAEAMLCGAPVVGVPEVLPEVVPEFAGRRVAPQDPEGLAVALAEALDTSWDRERIREHALGLDWGARIERFEEIYREVMTSHRRSD